MNTGSATESSADESNPKPPPGPQPPASSIFRETALQRLSSPEQLDQIIRVTSPQTWIALATSLVLLAGATLWSIFGAIPVRVSASGVLLDREGKLFPAAVRSAGLITDILVKAGDGVKAGQVIATLDAPELQRQLEGARSVLSTLTEMRQALATSETSQREGRRTLNESRLSAEREAIEAGTAYIIALRDELAMLEAKGGASEAGQRAAAVRKSLYEATRGVAEARDRLAALERGDRSLDSEWRDRLRELELRIADQTEKLSEISVRLDQASSVRSPVDGVVAQVSGAIGAVTAIGARIAIITTEAKETDAVLYLPVDSHAALYEGMPALVTPANIDPGEYGSILGRVYKVDKFLSDRQTITAVVQDQVLAERLSRKGPAFGVRVDLVESRHTASGYVWSSSGGPPFRIAPGTTASASITIRYDRPIQLIIPALGKLLGG